MPRWKTFARIYTWFSLLLISALVALFYPVIRFASLGLTAATASVAANAKAESSEAHNIDPHSLLGVDPSMLPKFEGIVERGASGSAAAHLGMGLLYQYKGLDTEAERMYRRAVELDPENPDAWFRLGILLQAHSRLEEAADAYDRSMRSKPGYWNGYYGLASVRQAQGRNEDAAHLYQEVIRQQPSQAQAHNNLAVVYENLGHSKDALKEYEEAARLDPKSPILQDNLAKARAEMGIESIPTLPQPRSSFSQTAAPPLLTEPVKKRPAFKPKDPKRVTFKSGRSLVGDIVEEDERGLWMEVGNGMRMHFSRTEIERVEDAE